MLLNENINQIAKIPEKIKRTLCDLHYLYDKIILHAQKNKYPKNINFENLENRIFDMKSDVKKIINGKAHSTFKDNLLKNNVSLQKDIIVKQNFLLFPVVVIMEEKAPKLFLIL